MVLQHEPSPSSREDSSPDITLHTRESDMRPVVRSYARKVHTELMSHYHDFGVTDMVELAALISKNPRAFVDHHATLSRIQELLNTLHAILSNPKEYKLPIAQEFTEKETELTELLGPDFFLGFDAIEKTFTLKDGTRVLDISPEERQEAMEQLLTKLAEPDVVDFLKNLESDPTEASKWMLVYRTSAKVTNPDTHQELPVSILSLRDVLDTDARQGTNPTKLVYRDDRDLKDWYRYDKKQGDTTPWASHPLQPGWMFVTKTVVDGTTRKKHHEQTPILKEKARSLRFADSTSRRRTPQEVLYDTIVVYKYTDGSVRLLEEMYDWTEQKTSSGHVVLVGYFGAGGVYVFDRDPDRAYDLDGACLSR